MRRDYYPFGAIYQSEGDDDSDYLFTGKELDEGNELYYFGARYYDVKVGRFLTQDPVREFHSPYVYCDNSPMKFTDPTGLSTLIDSTGKVHEVIPDGDLGIYMFNIGEDYGGRLLKECGTYVGETVAWNSFINQEMWDQFNAIVPEGRIDLASNWARERIDEYYNKLNPNDAKDFIEYSLNAGNNEIYDLKSYAPGKDLYYGSQIVPGVYISARDTGNIFAGLVARASGLKYNFAMSGFGAFQIANNSKYYR